MKNRIFLVCSALIMPIALINAQVPEKEFSKFTIDPSKCNGLRYHTGSQIFIPENAFVGDCPGPVTIKYREFHDPLDMVIHDIPMDFDFKGNKLHLESGGMFEIYAECMGKPLQLAPEKEIQVRMKCDRKLQFEGVFYFNDKTRIWELLSQPLLDFEVLPDEQVNPSAELWGNSPANGLAGDTIITMDPFTEEMMMSTAIAERLGEIGIFKGMNLSKFGLYNYDKVIDESESVPMVANFTIKGTGASVTTKTCVVYENMNSVIYYYPSDWNGKFVLLKGQRIKIFAILKDGSVAVYPKELAEKLNPEDYRNAPFNAELEIVTVPKNKTELAKATGVQP